MPSKLRIPKRATMLLALFALLATLTGCHTIQGVGRDVQGVGQKLQNEFD